MQRTGYQLLQMSFSFQTNRIPKQQKTSRFAGFANPFKKKSNSSPITSSASSSPSQNLRKPTDGATPAFTSLLTAKSETELGSKHLSLENAQERLVAENRRSPRQLTPVFVEKEFKQEEPTRDLNNLKVERGKSREGVGTPSPRIRRITTVEELRYSIEHFCHSTKSLDGTILSTSFVRGLIKWRWNH